MLKNIACWCKVAFEWENERKIGGTPLSFSPFCNELKFLLSRLSQDWKSSPVRESSGVHESLKGEMEQFFFIGSISIGSDAKDNRTKSS